MGNAVSCFNTMKKYQREFSELSDALVASYHHYEIWWVYKNEREKYYNIMNKYLMFFSVSVSAHFISMLMAISCLIDERYIGIKSLYKKMKNENMLSLSEVKNIDKKFSELSNIIKGIRILRGSVFAHISNKIDSESAFLKANLKYDDFKELIYSLGEIFNMMRIANGMNILGFNINSSKVDTNQLLNDLIDYKNSTN